MTRAAWQRLERRMRRAQAPGAWGDFWRGNIRGFRAAGDYKQACRCAVRARRAYRRARKLRARVLVG